MDVVGEAGSEGDEAMTCCKACDGFIEVIGTSPVDDVCADCYVNPVGNACERCGKKLHAIPYAYTCGACLAQMAETKEEKR